MATGPQVLTLPPAPIGPTAPVMPNGWYQGCGWTGPGYAPSGSYAPYNSPNYQPTYVPCGPAIPMPTGVPCDPPGKDLPVVAPLSRSSNDDGMMCRKCKDFYPYAEANQDDGTLVCYRCRVRW